MRITFTLFACFITTCLYCQHRSWIIAFTDKNNSPYTISHPDQFLSPKAIARRKAYDIPIDSSDLPVNPDYIQQIIAAGPIVYMNQSKWLNQILVSCDDSSVMDKINALPFVRSSVAADVTGSTRRSEIDRFDEKISFPKTEALTADAMGADTISYGRSITQIQMHNGTFLHDKGYRGEGITIAFLDAGFYHYKSLSAFDSVRINGQVLGEKDFVVNDNSVNEDDAHGMYCLSTVAANVPGQMIGTAPHAAFWLIRSENAFSESPVEEQNWVAAAEFADSAGADMISSSLGYFYFDDSALNHSYADFYHNSTTVSRGAAMAAKKGLIVTNSAGNEGNSQWRYIIFPADADSICAVGAVDGSGNIAGFSSYGYPGRVKPNIVSMGTNTTVWGTNNQPALGSGTSFANPNISGLIACLWQAFPRYNNMTILDAVYQSSDRYGHADSHYGYGIPDMHGAYLILKKKQNTELYGNDWLLAGPNPFSDTITVKFVSQVTGVVHLYLTDADGNVIRTIAFDTEEQEVYDTSFDHLVALSPGRYYIKYDDSIRTKAIIVSKVGGGVTDWLQAIPVPFSGKLVLYLTAPETGSIILRLLDEAGRVIETKHLMVNETESYTIDWTAAPFLSKGIYFIQYTGKLKKTIKIVK